MFGSWIQIWFCSGVSASCSGWSKRLGSPYKLSSQAEWFGQSLSDPSSRMRKLSHDAMPMPAHVPRSHHEASKVQEHAATAGLSKFHFHGFQRKELGLQLFLVRDSRSITTSFMPISRELGGGLTFLHRQRATFVCKVLLCRPTYQWPIACALNHATAQNGMEQ